MPRGVPGSGAKRTARSKPAVPATKEAVAEHLLSLASSLEDMAGVVKAAANTEAPTSPESAALLAGAKAYRTAAAMVETIAPVPVRRRRRMARAQVASNATTEAAPAEAPRGRGRPRRNPA